ncbi:MULTISPECIES: hypothetical protein [Salibacterium]|uniref:Uncharacterized protein n=1 Tax=Salibacterium lacus TaxID=1898109 RepID=A0ABW5T3F8_9BACI|nr:hypothetical protein [Salibacterium qingdaonense]
MSLLINKTPATIPEPMAAIIGRFSVISAYHLSYIKVTGPHITNHKSASEND